MTSTDHHLQVQSIAHGVVRLEQTFPEYGAERRRLIVLKYRGRQFLGGYHDYVIRPGGLVVYPRPIASEHRPSIVAEQLELAMTAAHAGSWQVDLTTWEFSASDRAIELHGLPPGSHLNHERALASVHPGDRVRDRKSVV